MNCNGPISNVLVLCGFVFLPFTMQTIGIFTPHWVSTSTCDSVGLVYSCCSGFNNDTCENTNGGNELDVRVLGLEATSFILMLLAVIVIVSDIWYELCYKKQDKVKGQLGFVCCCLLLLVIAGLLNFIGCLIIEANYSTDQLGWSYYLCQVTGSLYVFLTFTVCVTSCFSFFCRR